MKSIQIHVFLGQITIFPWFSHGVPISYGFRSFNGPLAHTTRHAMARDAVKRGGCVDAVHQGQLLRMELSMLVICSLAGGLLPSGNLT